MSKETGESKLKLIHLVYGLIAAGVIIGIYIGKISNQQSTNTKGIAVKVEKEVFNMHQEQQRIQFKKIDSSLDKIDGKLDEMLEK